LSLTEQELKEMDNLTHRMNTIASHAKKKGVRLMVDAEQTYFQPAITRITLDAMRIFNKESPIVFNTYQCYQKDAPNLVDVDLEFSRREGFCFAGKLVRGAYMEQERMRAGELEYSDPIHDTYSDTNECYNKLLTTILQEVKHNKANVMVASHNEESVRHTIATMKELGIQPDEDKVFFGQLLGMCDVITYALGSAGYAAYKYVPYGPVEEVMPYLSRRAMENRSLMKGVVKERDMLWSELVRRKKHKQLQHNPNNGV
jgi:proline dehydrogenase